MNGREASARDWFAKADIDFKSAYMLAELSGPDEDAYGALERAERIRHFVQERLGLAKEKPDASLQRGFST